MNRRLVSCLTALCLILTSAAMLSAADWPQFRGPERNGKSAETGLLKTWPDGGPKLLWKATGCGVGYSSPAIAKSAIYTAGDIGGQSCLVAFGTDGKAKGRLAFARGGPRGERAGMRSTPTVHGGMIYLLNPEGELLCASAANLRKRWQVNILRAFGGRNISWKLAESILVVGNMAVCTPGGQDAGIVALNRQNGKPIWASKGLSDQAAYASCMLMKVGRLPMITTMTAKGLVGVSAASGQFLWRWDRPANRTANCPSPVFEGNRIFEATGYGNGGGAVDIVVRGNRVSAQQAWETRDMVCHHGGYVLIDGHVYGNHGSGLACIDFKTGQTKWRGRGAGKGSVVYADGRLYCYGEGGTVALVEAKPDGYSLVSQFKLPAGGSGQHWAHPAIADGRLYIRHGDALFCFDIKAAAQEKPKPTADRSAKPADD